MKYSSSHVKRAQCGSAFGSASSKRIYLCRGNVGDNPWVEGTRLSPFSRWMFPPSLWRLVTIHLSSGGPPAHSSSQYMSQLRLNLHLTCCAVVSLCLPRAGATSMCSSVQTGPCKILSRSSVSRRRPNTALSLSPYSTIRGPQSR